MLGELKPKGPKGQHQSSPEVGVRILGLRRRELRERLVAVHHEDPFYQSSPIYVALPTLHVLPSQSPLLMR